MIGDGTLPYIVTGGPAPPANLPYIGITTTMSPLSGAASEPADVTINVSVSSSGYPAIYKFTTACDPLGGGAPLCQGGSTTTVSTPSATLPALHMLVSGTYFVVISGQLVRQSDCQITGLLYTHVSYTVNP